MTQTSNNIRNPDNSQEKQEKEILLKNLRIFREAAKDALQIQTAIHWAQLALNLSNDLSDKYQLALLYFSNKEFLRCLNFIKNDFRYLKAKCLFELEKFDEALDCCNEDSVVQNSEILFLKGEILLKKNNFLLAKEVLLKALSMDYKCIGALLLLKEKYLLTNLEEAELLAKLCKMEDKDGLGLIYSAYLKPGTSNAVFFDNFLADIERNFAQFNFKECLNLTFLILEQDPFNLKIVVYHASCLTLLKKRAELFKLAHLLVENYPKSPVSWFVIGCYYLLGDNADAKKAFVQSTTLDSSFVPSWVGYGNSLALLGEHEQALNAYATASRLNPNCYLCKVFIGMQYSLLGNYPIASEILKQCLSNNNLSSSSLEINITIDDPLVKNEMGVVLYNQNNYSEAVKMFKAAFESCCKIYNSETVVWGCELDSILVNLGRSYMKLNKLKDARMSFIKACDIGNRKPTSVLALAYLNHVEKRYMDAIKLYHEVLSLRPDDSFAQIILEKALTESAKGKNTFWDLLPDTDFDKYKPIPPEFCDVDDVDMDLEQEEDKVEDMVIGKPVLRSAKSSR